MQELTPAQWFIEANKKLTGSKLIEISHRDYVVTKDCVLKFVAVNPPFTEFQEIKVFSCKRIEFKNPYEIFEEEQKAKNFLFPLGGLKVNKIKESFEVPTRENGYLIWSVKVVLEMTDQVEIAIMEPFTMTLEVND